MDKTRRTLPITFEVNEEIETNDDRFLSVTIDVLHTGKNLNSSIFTKEVVDANIDTIKNTPILGFIEVGEEADFKGHEYILTKVDGELTRKYIGHAYGIIPESCNPRWIYKTCEDGEEREFLQVDGLMWTKFSDSVNIMDRDIEKGQSMELSPSSVDGYEDENGDFVFTEFSFDGCCILGYASTPAMTGANVQVNFTIENFVENIQKEIIEKYTVFTNLLDENKGGIKKMDFTQTAMELFSDISSIVKNQETYTDRWGYECARYYLHDIQDSEAIVVDRQNNYQFYGVSFTVNGDKPELDFASCKRKKTRYEDYSEDVVVLEGAFDFGSHIAELEEIAYSKVTEAESKLETVEAEKVEAETNYTNIQAEFDTTKSELETVKSDYEVIKTKLDDIEPKYNDYVQAEEQRKVDEMNSLKDAKISEFEELLSDVTEFTELKDKKDELSVEEIENKCAVMFYKKQAQSNFAKKTDGVSSTRIYNNEEDSKTVVSTKYGNIVIGK